LAKSTPAIFLKSSGFTRLFLIFAASTPLAFSPRFVHIYFSLAFPAGV
jgi:hypothetical protein